MKTHYCVALDANNKPLVGSYIEDAVSEDEALEIFDWKLATQLPDILDQTKNVTVMEFYPDEDV